MLYCYEVMFFLLSINCVFERGYTVFIYIRPYICLSIMFCFVSYLAK